MCGVRGKLTQVEGLIHNPLSSKSSVSMHQDGHHLEMTSYTQQDEVFKNTFSFPTGHIFHSTMVTCLTAIISPAQETLHILKMMLWWTPSTFYKAVGS